MAGCAYWLLIFVAYQAYPLSRSHRVFCKSGGCPLILGLPRQPGPDPVLSSYLAAVSWTWVEAKRVTHPRSPHAAKRNSELRGSDHPGFRYASSRLRWLHPGSRRTESQNNGRPMREVGRSISGTREKNTARPQPMGSAGYSNRAEPPR